ncbi:MAG: hypothetical protein CMF25_02370, partial [Kangiellaceae bacterium]|nr:hypothetical protein [Kangiellaceae bacterium]
VVADEVRTLAQRTQESTSEIQQMIENIQSSSAKAVDAMDRGQERTNNSVTKVSGTGELINKITLSVSHIKDMNTHIATAAEEQSHVAEDINQNIQGIVDITSQAQESIGTTTGTSETLNNIASHMQALISRFKY